MAAAASTANASTPSPGVTLGRLHARRLREVYRSAGWPCLDMVEVELLAAGLLQRRQGPSGHETLRVTDDGVVWMAQALAKNRAALSAHEALVEKVAVEMVRAGRVAWRGLGLRAQLPPLADGGPARWCLARPDVFSIRNTTVQAYADPIVHEIKVSRADLLGDLRRPEKRQAYFDLGGQCWYVLGNDARGRCIATADEVPADCGVMVVIGDRLEVVRTAIQRPRGDIPFHVWMSLAKATPVRGLDDDTQSSLTDSLDTAERLASNDD